MTGDEQGACRFGTGLSQAEPGGFSVQTEKPPGSALRASIPSAGEYRDCPFDSRLARTPYLVLPKLAIQVMPYEWRVRFDTMLAEMEMAGIETPEYHVFRDDGPGNRYTRATVVNESTGFVRIVRGDTDPWADYRHMKRDKVAALCPAFAQGIEAGTGETREAGLDGDSHESPVPKGCAP